MSKSHPRKPKKGRSTRTDSLASRRLLESLLDPLATEEPGGEIERAQEIIYDAMETADRRRRVALAKKALEVSPLCADAYVLLAQEAAEGSEEELDFYRRGVEAGERALGETAFTDDVGHFWGILETRPYMRARQGLALALWTRGIRDDAVAHFKEMLRLNPNDNQGIRYVLLNRLLELGHDADIRKLLKTYPEDGSSEWLYSVALSHFRRVGDGDRSRQALVRAVETNPHVPAYLLGKKTMPRTLPSLLAWGGPDEAVAYVHDARPAWVATPGALTWAETVADGLAKPASRAKSRSFPKFARPT